MQPMTERKRSDRGFDTAIDSVPVTAERPPYNPTQEQNSKLVNPGTAHANIAASLDAPNGTQVDRWATKHSDQTVLQQHCDFFDTDNDGVIWPLDTYRGFRDLGFNIILSIIAVVIIHANFSYPTGESIFPDPFFRLHVKNIHKAKHGSDTGTYDSEGRFIPSRFEDFFNKYGGDKDGLSKLDIWNGLKGQRVIMDPIGSFGAMFEWLATYLLLWPEDGIIKKEDVRRVYDGSIFHHVASQRAGRTKDKAT